MHHRHWMRHLVVMSILVALPSCLPRLVVASPLISLPLPLDVPAVVPSHHYVGRMGCHIFSWSARWCRTHLWYHTRKVKHQMGIFQITTLVHLQGAIHRSMYESSATTGHSLQTHRISPTILLGSCQPSGIGDKQECLADVNLKKILLHFNNLSQLP